MHTYLKEVNANLEEHKDASGQPKFTILGSTIMSFLTPRGISGREGIEKGASQGDTRTTIWARRASPLKEGCGLWKTNGSRACKSPRGRNRGRFAQGLSGCGSRLSTFLLSQFDTKDSRKEAYRGVVQHIDKTYDENKAEESSEGWMGDQGVGVDLVKYWGPFHVLIVGEPTFPNVPIPYRLFLLSDLLRLLFNVFLPRRWRLAKNLLVWSLSLLLRSNNLYVFNCSLIFELVWVDIIFSRLFRHFPKTLL